MSVLRSICGRNPLVSGVLLSSIDTSYFHNEYSRELYARVLNRIKVTGEVPAWRELYEDPKLQEETRDKIKSIQIERIKTKLEAKNAVTQLNHYRQLRGIFYLVDESMQKLRGKKADPEELLTNFADRITELRQSKSTEHSILSFGVGNNTVKIVRSLLDKEQKNFIPTGFDNFDRENGGITFGSLFTIGGTSGGGKCLRGHTQITLVNGTTTLEQIWENTRTNDILIEENKRVIGAYRLLPVPLEVVTYEGPSFIDKVFKTSGPTIRITLDDKTMIEGLAEHELKKAYSKWTRLDQLDKNMHVISFNKKLGIKKIISVEHTGQVHPVFDIEVRGYHHYIANGVVSHNSALASQLCLNWSGMGETVVLIPLEMSEEEQVARIMANVSELDVRKIIFQRLSREEKIKYLKAFKRLVLRNKRAGGSYRIFKPQSDMAIEDIMVAIYPTNARIVIVDYISLLKGVDGDKAWEKLGAVARYCKVYAENHNKIVVLLAQVNEEGKIRYARAIAEHSSSCWVFVATKQSRENELITIEQTKARNGRQFDFSLRARLDVMQIRDLELEEQQELEAQKKKRRKGKVDNVSKNAPTEKYLNDIAAEGDE
jgi:replicative DNA helicase